MRLRDQVWLSFHNLMLHKVRSILTSLGIIFGVGSVIAMLAISEGAKIQALAQIEAMGTDKIIVATRKPPASGKDVSDSSGQSLMDRYGITTVDLDHIRKMDNVEQVSVARNSRKKILSGMKRLDLSLVGVSIDFLKFSRSNIVQGRWLSQIDGINNTCVIGLNVKRALFSLGEKDILTPDALEFFHHLEKLGCDVRCTVYGNSGHSFTTNRKGEYEKAIADHVAFISSFCSGGGKSVDGGDEKVGEIF